MSDWTSIYYISTIATRLSVEDALERLEDNKFGLSSGDVSDFEADGIYGYMPETNDEDLFVVESSKGALDNKKAWVIVALLLQCSSLALSFPG